METLKSETKIGAFSSYSFIHLPRGFEPPISHNKTPTAAKCQESNLNHHHAKC